jgi:hypothetical protein
MPPKKRKSSTKPGRSRNPVGSPAPVRVPGQSESGVEGAVPVQSESATPLDLSASADHDNLNLSNTGDDFGSDDGSFRDDEDIGDFIPTHWQQRNSDPDRETTATADITVATFFQVQEKTPGKVNGQLTKSFKGSEISTKTTTSRIIVPIVPTIEPRSLLEVQKDELAKKDRDLRSARARATQARLKAEKIEKARDEEISQLRRDLHAEHKVQCENLKQECRDIEAERDKATIDLRKLREGYEKLKSEKEKIQKKLFDTKAAAMTLQKQNSSLRESNSKGLMMNSLRRAEALDMQRKCRNLEADLALERGRCARLSQSITTLEMSNRDIRAQKSQQDSSSFREGLNIRNDYYRLSREHQALKVERDDFKRETNDAKKELQDHQSQTASLQSKLALVELDMQILKESDKYSIGVIRETCKELDCLKRERDLLEPIIYTVRDISLRIFEQAREIVYDLSRGYVDRAIIQNGNRAAHSANGLFLSALFQANLIPEEYLDNATEIFEELYGMPPKHYGHRCQVLRRAADCVATLRTLKPLNNGRGSIHLREEHESWVALLPDYRGAGDAYADHDPEAFIDRLEFLTEQIVEIDRRRNGHGTRNKGRVSPTNLFPRAYTADTLTRLLLIIRRKTMIATRMSMTTKMSTGPSAVFL